MKGKYIKGVIAVGLVTSMTTTYATTAVMAMEKGQVKTEEKKVEEIKDDKANSKDDKESIKDQKPVDKEINVNDKEYEGKKEEEVKKDEPKKDEVKNEEVDKSSNKEEKEKLKEEENKKEEIKEKDKVEKKEEVKENVIPVEVWGDNMQLINEVCSKTGINDIKNVTYDDIAKIKMLELQNSYIKNPEIMSKFTGLVSLNLQMCHNAGDLLEHISKIKGLKELDISICGLKALPDSLSNLSNLESIDISANDFGKIPDAIYKMTGLKDIAAARCGVKNISNDIANIKKLTSLELFCNDLATLPSALYELNTLRYLGLEQNLFTEIPSGIFNMKNIEDVSFRDNKIIKIPEEIIGMKGDKISFTLDVGLNQITNLPQTNNQNIIFESNFIPSSISGVSNSNRLELQQKVLEVSSEKEYSQEDLRKLVKGVRYHSYYGKQIFDIDSRHKLEFVIDNKVVKAEELKNLDEGVYDAKIKIESADLNNPAAITYDVLKIKVGNVEVKPDENNKPNIPDNATGLIPLEYWEDCNPLMLDVINALEVQGIKEVQDIKEVTFEDIEQIEVISLENQQLTKLPNIIEKFKSLKKINLSNNLFTEIPKQLYKLNTLTNLGLSDNKIVHMTKELIQLENLKGIYLDNNDIKEIDDEVKEMKSLIGITLPGNKNIQPVLHKIFEIKTLSEILISDCNLTYISDNIKNLPNLEKIYYSNNQLVKDLYLPGVRTRSYFNFIESKYEDDKKLILDNKKLEVIKGLPLKQENLRNMLKVRLRCIPEEYEDAFEKVAESHNISFVVNGKEYTADEVNKFKSGKYEAKLKLAAADIDNDLAITDEVIDLTINGRDSDDAIDPNKPDLGNVGGGQGDSGNVSGSNNSNTTSSNTDGVVTTSNSKLPKTGGISAVAAALFGIVTITTGAVVYKKKK